MPIFFFKKSEAAQFCIASIAEHDGVDGGDVAAGDVAVIVDVAIDKVLRVAIEQVVVERGDIGTANVPVAVHVASNGRALDFNMTIPIITINHNASTTAHNTIGG